MGEGKQWKHGKVFPSQILMSVNKKQQHPKVLSFRFQIHHSLINYSFPTICSFLKLPVVSYFIPSLGTNITTYSIKHSSIFWQVSENLHRGTVVYICFYSPLQTEPSSKKETWGSVVSMALTNISLFEPNFQSCFLYFLWGAITIS